ncbi:Alpha/Beta hydrolase protein [Geopyxis carbonaria]|nr:Alpha/Beta hydrolase protein [Geopyxis carbonaria]
MASQYHSAPSQASRDLGTASQPAAKAHRITPHDTVVSTSDGQRLPGVPLAEAARLNASRASSASCASTITLPKHTPHQHAAADGGSTTIDVAPAFTDPLFPPLPVYGPATPLRRLQCLFFRASSGVLSLAFLGVIVMGAVAETLPGAAARAWERVRGRDPDRGRPFLAVERERARERKQDEAAWEARGGVADEETGRRGVGGRDELRCDIAYYARRVGLECETFTVETEDGFLLEMQHVWDPLDPPYYPPATEKSGEKEASTADREGGPPTPRPNGAPGRRRYPVLLMHGLLQSAGAFCVNDSDSLAFFLAKSGYDVFLGNSRCGLLPRHSVLTYGDPRMWAWNIRQMGTLDLPAFIDTILSLTSFPHLALVAHSQGTTQTFVALAKQQRPDLGRKISVFCALAPAVYAGPLIDKMYFKFMRAIPPAAFRFVFGIHAFIPAMMAMHGVVPARVWGRLGYRVFWFLFGWSDARWDRGLRDRFFRFAPVYVSAETMRWWLGRECFARHRCILSTRAAAADDEDADVTRRDSDSGSGDGGADDAWFDHRFPPLALWVAGSDALVDGKRLIRRVHAKVIEEYEHGGGGGWWRERVGTVMEEGREG